MAKDTANNAAKNKRVRQQALRDQLQAQGHVQHVVDILAKLTDEAQEITSDMMERYKVVLPNKLKLINKYVPDVKAIEIEGNISSETHEEWLSRLDG